MTQKMKLTGKKFILMLLYSPVEGEKTNIPISGRTRFMKMGFLFDKELKKDFEKDKIFEEILMPEYFAWKYGPFSKELLNDLEFLINQEYIEVLYGPDNSPFSSVFSTIREYERFEYWIENFEDYASEEYNEEIFKLTHKGILKAEKIWQILTKNKKNILIEFKYSLNRAPLDKILKYVYKKYSKEGYIDNSLIREKYL